MDNRCIGVFDSGLGGLTAVKEILHLMPQEEIVYFGDTGRVPYGTRSEETILKYVSQDIAFLQQFSPKVIVAACGTASAVALPKLEGTYPIPVMGVVDAAALAALEKTKNRKIGILGTGSTIKSGAYERLIKELAPDAETVSVACPLFVPLVENGYIEAENPVTRLVAQEYLEPLMRAGVDTIILGCTHYPLLKPVLSAIIGMQVALVDPGMEVSRRLYAYLSGSGMLCQAQRMGVHRYFVSDSADGFSRIGSLFLGEPISQEVQKIEIERIQGGITHEKECNRDSHRQSGISER